MFQILRNDVIDNINQFNLVNVFASIKYLNTKNRTSNFFQITCPGTSSTFQYFHTPVQSTSLVQTDIKNYPKII